jgi:adenylate kinase
MKNERLAIIMLGPPGSGKGTQARQMGESLRFPHISTGDMLREALKNETELGKRAKAFMESGELVPDELVDAIVAERIDREDCRRGFILDGYPRTLLQAEFLGSVLEKDKTRLLTLGIEVGDEEVVKRLASRWTCPKCGKMFNANLNPEKAGGQCDECHTALIQREDDTSEVITERLQVYNKKTAPLIQFYQKQGAYIAINGDRPVEQIFESIMSEIARCE